MHFDGLCMMYFETALHNRRDLSLGEMHRPSDQVAQRPGRRFEVRSFLQQRQVRLVCDMHGIVVEAYSSLGQGLDSDILPS
jgi:hypothetical protein